jgi:tight adherence protein B
MQADGATALNDAVAMAVAQLGTEGSRNIVLLSDGKDEGSATSAKKARTTLAASGAALDAVSITKGGQHKQLAAFAKAGGGSMVTATDAESMTAAFVSAARTVDTQLAVTAQVPDDVSAGTAEVTVTAVAGGQPISDTVAALVEPSAEVAAAEVGPIPVADPEPGLVDREWFLGAVVAMVFVGLVIICLLALGALDAKNRKEGRVQRRLDEVATAGGPRPQAAGAQQSALGDGPMTRAVMSLAEKVAASRDTSALARHLDQANLALRPAEWAVVHALIMVLAGLLATVLGGFNTMVTTIAVVAAAVIPWVYLSQRASRRRSEFYAALPDSLQMMSGSLAAGYSLPQALDGVARETGGAFGQETNRALLESRLGLPIEESLEATAQRMHSTDFHWVVMAIRTNRQVGGNLAEVLTNVGKTLRERERLRRQIKTLSAEGKLSAWIIGALPILMLIFMVLFRPDFVAPLFTTPIGWVMVGLGLAAYLAGIVWMHKLVHLEV